MAVMYTCAHSMPEMWWVTGPGHRIRHARSSSSSRASPPQAELLDDDDEYDEMMAQLFPDLPRYDSAAAFAKGRRRMSRAAGGVAVGMVAIRQPAILIRCRRRVHVDPTSPYDTCNFLSRMPLHVDELRII